MDKSLWEKCVAERIQALLAFLPTLRGRILGLIKTFDSLETCGVAAMDQDAEL